jgi:FdhD protein
MLTDRPSGEATRKILRYRDGTLQSSDDTLAAEEPMEIRLQWEEDGALLKKSIAITMRTPGNDFDLAAGFLFGEGVLQSREDVVDISYCPDEDEPEPFNIVTVTLVPGKTFDAGRLNRNFFTTSSCGVCGKAALDALEVQGCAAIPGGFTVDHAVISALPDRLRAAQTLFQRTGGIHASGLFDCEGVLLSLAEDVGRHNALDKLIGARFRAGTTPLDGTILLLSGRMSFELVQKALVARIPVIAAVGAPSSLAIELAESFNITVAGFVRPGGFNIYSGAGRIAL